MKREQTVGVVFDTRTAPVRAGELARWQGLLHAAGSWVVAGGWRWEWMWGGRSQAQCGSVLFATSDGLDNFVDHGRLHNHGLRVETKGLKKYSRK
jgi:hypothetical protein